MTIPQSISKCGLIRIKAECKNGKVTQVTFKNVPAFAVYLDKEIDVPHLGKVTVDVAWGGIFYVIADVRQFPGMELITEHGAGITRVTSLILGAAQQQLPVAHPDYPGIGITNVQFSGPTAYPNADWKNSVRVGSGLVDLDNPATWTAALDRCSCGTGTCVKMAVLHAKGRSRCTRNSVMKAFWALFIPANCWRKPKSGNTTRSYPP